ncbi:MAG: ester cyclase [Gemmatimonadaceae bacterium]
MADGNLKQYYRAYIEEVWNRGNVDAIGRFIDGDIVDHAAPPGQGAGLDGVTDSFRMMRAAFPNAHIDIEQMIEEDDFVVALLTLSGTHTGTFFGIPATGRTFAMRATHTLRYRGGKMVEHWSNSDDLGMLRQLGVIPDVP